MYMFILIVLALYSAFNVTHMGVVGCMHFTALTPPYFKTGAQLKNLYNFFLLIN